MRRLHLRGRANILKRLLIHVGAFNLSLAPRKRLGAGTPRGLADASDASQALTAALGAAAAALGDGLAASRQRQWTAHFLFALSRPISPLPFAA